VPTPQQRLDLDRVLNVIQAPAAVVILVSERGEIETAGKGVDNPAALFEICWSVAVQLAAELYEDLPDEQRQRARLVLPSADEAKRLGIFNGGRNV
jgi:hypothetical protein